METPYNNPFTLQDEESLDIKQEVSRYLRFWPWFVLALGISLVTAFLYLRYSPRIYETSSKIKILDESEGLELPTSAFIFNRSNINLENEVEILNSYVILQEVVKEQQLNFVFHEVGNVRATEIGELPFYFMPTIDQDSLRFTTSRFSIEVTDKGFEILNEKTEKVEMFADYSTLEKSHTMPFNIKIVSERDLIVGRQFVVTVYPLKQTILGLKRGVVIEPIGEQSDLLKLTMQGESAQRSERILNTLVRKFDEDGITDRQLVSERTIDFIDERFELLAFELDSIELVREDYKQNNNLVDLTADAELGLEQRTRSDQEVFNIENQLALAKLLQNALKNEDETGLLPANFGLESSGINTLVEEYNMAILNRDKLISSGGRNNPSVQLVVSQLQSLRVNITASLKAYVDQLQVSQRQLQSRNKKFVGQVSQIPEKERLLRAIERNQKIKESLYLLLLQKREEAAINLAITEPSIKVVEYALSGTLPVSPKRNIVYAAALLGGLLIPFAVLYVMFMLDTKLHSKEDIVKLDAKIPVVAEIPDMRKSQHTIFDNPNDRSALAESFRILSSNVRYILPKTGANTGNIIYCTSTIKGEGKTYVSLNLSLALASLNKKVLLIGADLRNPQIHTLINLDKNQLGLSNYLHDSNIDWHDLLTTGFEKHPQHRIILSGSIPPNPAHLLTNGRFEQLINEAKLEYDYIIIDTAPTILVTDTLLISQFADATIYIARANYTEKKLLNFSKDLFETGKLKNMAYVVNSVGASKSYGYGYNYGYDYGYGSQG